ncbi:hypothetical protein HU200_055956 [Digitaria exilis]|uniref:Uncharacterized protein n=1 Tax=Digitaria exilis TaxID=1010633 RepID=A0A835AJ34_9POAL|nr:hypothetical protein HU200_055956 [Digitaria exilis]
MVHEQSNGSHHHHHQQLLPRYGSGAATGVARASKKNKPKKIPQRGLGVAQLEKLRIEEQKKMEGSAAAVSSGVAHSHALAGAGGGGGSLGHLLSMHPPPPISLSALPRPVPDGGGGGFSPVLSWDPADAMRHHQYKTSSMAWKPFAGQVTTGLSLTVSSSHPTEPPSNQMYCSSITRNSGPPAEDDRDAASVDRSWPFMFEGMNVAAFRRTTGKAPFAARPTRDAAGLPDVCPDLSFRAVNYFSTNANYPDWPSEFAPCKSSKENGCTGEPAYLTLNAQPVPHIKQPPHMMPSIHLPEYSDFGVMQSQASFVQGSVSSSSSRPFYSFMPVGPVRCERSLGDIKFDVSDGVDLELRL